MAKPTSAKGILKAAGLHVVLERDATIGYEYLVQRDGRTLCSGWSSGNKTDAYDAALTDAFDKGLVSSNGYVSAFGAMTKTDAEKRTEAATE